MYFVDCTATEFLKSKKNGFPLSFLLVKITFEKFSADQAKSDYLLEQFMTDVGRVLTLHQRPTDLVARFSKQKVVALLAEATRPGAESFMERVKKDIDKQQGYFCEAHGVLVQVGFTIRNFPEDTPEREAMLSFLEQVWSRPTKEPDSAASDCFRGGAEIAERRSGIEKFKRISGRRWTQMNADLEKNKIKLKSIFQ